VRLPRFGIIEASKLNAVTVGEGPTKGLIAVTGGQAFSGSAKRACQADRRGDARDQSNVRQGVVDARCWHARKTRD